jgi:hypothetical protein
VLIERLDGSHRTLEPRDRDGAILEVHVSQTKPADF